LLLVLLRSETCNLAIIIPPLLFYAPEIQKHRHKHAAV
jgi:hypothetical protein